MQNKWVWLIGLRNCMKWRKYTIEDEYDKVVPWCLYMIDWEPKQKEKLAMPYKHCPKKHLWSNYGMESNATASRSPSLVLPSLPWSPDQRVEPVAGQPLHHGPGGVWKKRKRLCLHTSLLLVLWVGGSGSDTKGGENILNNILKSAYCRIKNTAFRSGEFKVVHTSGFLPPAL
jgi:hypothetical protein